jgi:hypothetical protein
VVFFDVNNIIEGLSYSIGIAVASFDIDTANSKEPADLIPVCSRQFVEVFDLEIGKIFLECLL